MKTKMLLIFSVILLSVTVSFGQGEKNKIIVTGLVTDIQKKPIADAIILVDGEETNTTTNNRGLFKISVEADADSISVVALNYPLGKAAVSERPIVFRLYPLPDSTTLRNQEMKAGGLASNPVVYGQVDETSSTPNVDAKKRKYDSYNSIYEMLRSIPGVQVVRGDGLTGPTNVYVRGGTSIMGNNQPLFIVNGTQRDNIDDIMPSMVKDIEVLKGPSASIYGSRGATGVILITVE